MFIIDLQVIPVYLKRAAASPVFPTCKLNVERVLLLLSETAIEMRPEAL